MGRRWIRGFLILVAVFCLNLNLTVYSYGGLFHKTDRELLQKALHTENPKKVKKCLRELIKRKNYQAVMRIKIYATKMIRKKRAELLKSPIIKAEWVKKNLSPWVRIKHNSEQFLRKRHVNTVKQ